MKTYVHLCAYLEGNSLNIYWSKECFSGQNPPRVVAPTEEEGMFSTVVEKNKHILYPAHFSINFLR
jgi:hypothetical protein